LPAGRTGGGLTVRIAIVSDAWHPQRNGVVRVLESLCATLAGAGHETVMITPDRFISTPCPTYPEIRLAVLPGRKVARLLDEARPDAIHIASEGPLGWAARRYCLRRGFPFTTAYHTKFPQYVHARLPLPLSWLYGVVRRFHAPSSAVLAPSATLARELEAWRFRNVRTWAHGVDTSVFYPRPRDYLDGKVPRPIHLYIGRVAVEKNLPAFLDLDLPGSKVVVGDGPQRQDLIRRYPQAHFLIAHSDDELAGYYSAADVFVFPSRTDTFGLVMLEALACGTPVAGFPVPGPLDVLGDARVGCLDDDLAKAVRCAMQVPSAACSEYAAQFSWSEVSRQFLAALRPVR
jgi:glycosyltransferase involved in cell wall biosynthesis